MMVGAYGKIHDKLDAIVETQSDIRVDVGKIQEHLKAINGRCYSQDKRIGRLEKTLGGTRDKLMMGTGIIVALAAIANIAVVVLF